MVTTTEAVAGSATVSVPVPVLVSGPVSVSVRGREQHGTSLRDSAGPQGRALFVWVPPIGARVAPAVAVTPPALWEGMTQTNRPLQSRTNQPLLALELSHEMLDHIAPLLRGVAKHDRSLADQLRSAAQSVTLNLAESAGHHGGNRRLRYESALGRRRGRDSVTARDEGRALRRHVGSADDGGPTSRRLPDSPRPSGRRSR